MQRYVETDEDDDGFGDVPVKLMPHSVSSHKIAAKRGASPSKKIRRPHNLAQFVEADPRFEAVHEDHGPNIADLSLDDRGQDTIRRRPNLKPSASRFSLAGTGASQISADGKFGDFGQDEADADGEAEEAPSTLRGRPKALHNFVEDDLDEGFEFPAGPLKLPAPRPGASRSPPREVPDLGMFDSDRSPSRHSHSSSVSSVGSALTESLDDDDAFDLGPSSGTEPLDLRARFQARELRSKIESSSRDVMQANLSRAQHRSREVLGQFTTSTDEDELDGLDFDRANLTRGAVNQNVVFGTIRRPPPRTLSRPSLAPGRLRPSASSAQLPRAMPSRSQLAGNGAGQTLSTSPSKRSQLGQLGQTGQLHTAMHAPRPLRPAQSMYDIGGFASRGSGGMARRTFVEPTFEEPEPPRIPYSASMATLSPHKSSGGTLRQRPLAVYAEPEEAPRRPKKPSRRREPVAADAETLQDRRRRKIGLIRNPGSAHAPQEVDGMVLNPATGQWEGNDADAHKFDTVSARGKMLIQVDVPAPAGDMVFDAENLCWRPRSGVADDDPFGAIEDLALAPRAARASTASFASSAARREASAAETFVVPAATQRRWRDADARFVRKFGRWISGEGEPAAAAYDIYKMVN